MPNRFAGLFDVNTISRIGLFIYAFCISIAFITGNIICTILTAVGLFLIIYGDYKEYFKDKDKNSEDYKDAKLMTTMLHFFYIAFFIGSLLFKFL